MRLPKGPPAQSCFLVAGGLLVVAGLAWIYPPAGLIAAGAGLLALGWPT